ncbi:low molecular weight phosphotyrosine protein phosphatase [Aquabacterium lacunae]|uniref:protein-tyrosine-phosphatase n=1 Tax=Aquabacterium lacunae TaxID=2528630 RepID=A0A4Q9GY08_9BURK|nr:low molecular weight protein-tyrosine-phosphatase [Aquabacterium lacunae]TBO30252.1 low molecular weight phosphotyrosine protein phosphatase [Aquabacterium lacunae]
MVRILFVCMGNLCRSPMAASVFTHQAARHPLGAGVQVSSAGTSSRHQGEAADPRAVQALARGGYPVDARFKARTLNSALICDSDLVLTMDQAVHLQTLRRSPPQGHARIHMLMPFAGHPVGSEIPDPYFGNQSGFEHVLKLLEGTVDTVLRRAHALRSLTDSVQPSVTRPGP